jgi:hypothetical protein
LEQIRSYLLVIVKQKNEQMQMMGLSQFSSGETGKDPMQGAKKIQGGYEM